MKIFIRLLLAILGVLPIENYKSSSLFSSIKYVFCFFKFCKHISVIDDKFHKWFWSVDSLLDSSRHDNYILKYWLSNFWFRYSVKRKVVGEKLITKKTLYLLFKFSYFEKTTFWEVIKGFIVLAWADRCLVK